MERYDVAVIGAGLAGLWCARDLARTNARVLLVDDRPDVDGFVRTTGIFVRRTFEEFAFPPSCLREAIRRVVLHSPRGRRIEFESEHDEFRVGDMRRLYRALLDDCIRAGVDWQPHTCYRGLRVSDAAATLFLRDRAYDERAAPRRVTAAFVVGADGARSRVAADLGLPRNDDFLVGVEDVYEDLAEVRTPSLHCFLDPALAPGYLAWVVRETTAAHIGVGGRAGSFRPAQSLQRFEASVGALVDHSSARAHERRGGLIPVNGVPRRIACERGLLVGDAAGAVSPLTAGGLDACVRLSAFAAQVITKALRHRSADALCEYDGTRFTARFIARRWLRLAFRRADVDMLELVCRLISMPPLKPLGRAMFFGHGSFPDPPPVFARALRAAQRPAG